MYPKFFRMTMALQLLLLMIINVIGEKLPPNHHQEQPSSSPHHMNNSVLVFFTLNDLKVGNKIPIFFRGTNNKPSSNSPHFLPREEAQSIPFSHSKLPYLLQLFGFSRASSQAQAMEDTLRQCEMKPIHGETKFCATSLESMLDFVHQIFGSSTNFKVLSTKYPSKYDNFLQNYTILGEPREVFAPKMVACHTMPYPYVVYYCHYQESESKVFEISLRGENGKDKKNAVIQYGPTEVESDEREQNSGNNTVEAIAVCHMDTSQWSHNHVSFRVLRIGPGSSPVCHFFPADNLVWVPVFDNIEGSKEKDSAM